MRIIGPAAVMLLTLTVCSACAMSRRAAPHGAATPDRDSAIVGALPVAAVVAASLPLTVDVWPAQAAQRDSVMIEAAGFAPAGIVAIGFGPPDREYRIIQEARADDAGVVRARISLPQSVQHGEEYVFVLGEKGGPAEARSRPILIATIDQPLTVRGHADRPQHNCPVVRSRNGKLYALMVPFPLTIEPGIEVVVRGSLAAVSLCGPLTMLDVDKLTRIRDWL